MKQTAVNKVIKHFFKNTTLHGFKYLYSAYFVDRACWLVCCCASACCAGVLCAVLWERFLEVPALLTLWDNTNSNKYLFQKIPTVIVCPPTFSIAEMFLNHLSSNNTDTKRIPITLERLLDGRSTDKTQVDLLDDLLSENKLDLSQVITKYTPDCKEHTKRCRYHQIIVPCELLFKKELVTWGLCCVMQPKKLKNLSKNPLAKLHSTEMLDLVLQCTQGSSLHGCQFITVYDNEENVESNLLKPGNYYLAQLRFSVVPDNPEADDLVAHSCLSDTHYSRTYCLMRCAERSCGCTDPFHPKRDPHRLTLPVCRVTQIACLRKYENRVNLTCNCLPACTKITTFMIMDSSPLNYVEHTIDPLYDGIDVPRSIVVNLRVNVGDSRIFVLNPTETWFTLLSSLGGVFNMFLGVGLFSALEILYLMLVKLPMAIKKSSEIEPTTLHTTQPTVRY